MQQLTINSCKTLHNGVQMPYLGLGVFRVEDGDQVKTSVCAALQAGYRHIDTATAYHNEDGVGQGIIESGIPRNEIFLTTKLWNEDSRQDRCLEAFEKSLELLKTDYLDLYLIHWPVPGKYVDSWKALEKLYAKGRVKAVGVSNFHAHHLQEIRKVSDLIPVVNQIECHPLLSQEPLVEYCEKQGISVTAWSPLGGLKLNLTANELLSQIGKKYGKSAAQVILRWDLQRGIITIPKSVKPERIKENSQIFDFELTSEDMKSINAMNTNTRAGSDPDNFNF